MTIRAFDFFSGCGGTSCGLRQAGIDVAFALDNDPKAIDTFQANFPDAVAISADIRNFLPQELSAIIGERNSPLLFSGCAPCQPFSKQNNHKSKDDPRRDLLSEFLRFVSYWKPEYVLIENVPGIQKVSAKGPFNHFIKELDSLGYNYTYQVLSSRDFGVPQKRDRLVLVASINGVVALPQPTHGPSTGTPFSTVRSWIGGLSRLEAGEKCSLDPDHQAASLSPLNLRRIKATPEGKGRESWPEELWLDCHRNHVGHTDVYGRLHWDRPASGLTTRCISLSNGRFGHPDQDRAISIREAACLQTFPKDYRFKGNLGDRAKQIGNAVPPLLSKTIAQEIIRNALAEFSI